MEKMESLIRTHAYVNGQWIAASSGDVFEVNNPATGDMIAAVADLGRGDIRLAIDAAYNALPGWREITAKERASFLMAWFRLIQHHRETLARLMTMECGKPLAESRGEVDYGASFIEWFAEEGKRVYGETIPSPGKGKRIVVIRQAIGVAAAITPWNFPLAMITRKAGPALAAGCSIVIKPAEATPLTALALAELAANAGLPAGVLNVVTTRNSNMAGLEFCENEKISKLSFTGSTRVGKLLLQQCAGSVKKVSLELGGNAPFIIFEDANIDHAIKGVMASKFRNAGQTCICANRVLVHEKIYDPFVEKLMESVGALRLGNGLDEHVSVGPLINRRGVQKVKELIQDAMDKGASCISGAQENKGLFFRPTVLSGVTMEMRVAREEIFGPVIPLFKFGSEEEAIALANNTPYGLAAYFYSRDISRCWRMAEALEYGIIGINEGLVSTEVAPFGGVKQSGIGREGSRHGIDEYVEMKYLCYGHID
jgi:succinate-semialdehyde dehydrogenase/glutarate-semialdehyde dehydrogenase